MVDAFIETVDAIVNRVRRNVQRREANEISMLLDIWFGLDAVFEHHDALMAYCGKKGLDIQTCLNGFVQTVLGYLKDLHEEFKVVLCSF